MPDRSTQCCAQPSSRSPKEPDASEKTTMRAGTSWYTVTEDGGSTPASRLIASDQQIHANIVKIMIPFQSYLSSGTRSMITTSCGKDFHTLQSGVNGESFCLNRVPNRFIGITVKVFGSRFGPEKQKNCFFASITGEEEKYISLATTPCSNVICFQYVPCLTAQGHYEGYPASCGGI